MIPLFTPIMAAWVLSLAPNLERMFLTRLVTVSSVIDSRSAICLFRIARGDQPQDIDFRFRTPREDWR